MKKIRRILCLCVLLFTLPLTALASDQVPVPGQVTMVDLGAKTCIPCKMMAPILEKLTADYEDTAAIIFIDVWENSSQAKKFRVSMIPTQIFFDADGNEVSRHVGFMAEAEIIAQLDKMGVPRPAR
ncbi:MAG: thiol reductase thioredoxin [Desulfobulbaceae bacterium]|nr:MAG: thiol reductase thioredoxin [Desulfobulbaceae bacterium]